MQDSWHLGDATWLKVRCQVLGLHGKIPGQVEFALASLHNTHLSYLSSWYVFQTLKYLSSAPSCHLVSTLATGVHGSWTQKNANASNAWLLTSQCKPWSLEEDMWKLSEKHRMKACGSMTYEGVFFPVGLALARCPLDGTGRSKFGLECSERVMQEVCWAHVFQLAKVPKVKTKAVADQNHSKPISDQYWSMQRYADSCRLSYWIGCWREERGH